jgi:hypothetical protein
MSLLLKRIATALVTGVMGGALLLTGSAVATVAGTPPTLTVDSISPNPVIVGDQPVTVTFKVTSNGDKVTAKLQPQLPFGPDRELVGTRDGTSNTWTFQAVITIADLKSTTGILHEGQMSFIPTATAADGTPFKPGGFPFAIKAESPTRIVGLNVRPRLAFKGHKIFFSGRLQTRPDGAWLPFAGETVKIVFKPFHGPEVIVSTTKTNLRGKFFAYTKAVSSGWYRAVFVGRDQFAASASKNVFVKVFSPHKR